MIQIPNLANPKTYRRATGSYLSYDFVYKPESFKREMVAGGYGEPVSYKTVTSSLGQYPQEPFMGAIVVGTDAGRYLARRLINHYENYGFWGGYCNDRTKVIAVIPLEDAAGCGSCPGDTVVLSPEYGYEENLDTLYHEYLHNCGHNHEYDKDGNQINKESDICYVEAAKVKRYLLQCQEF